MLKNKLKYVATCIMLSFSIMFTATVASAAEVQGVSVNVLTQIFAKYGDSVEIRPNEAIIVYVNPYNDDAYYEIPVYQDSVAVGSFSLLQEGIVRSDAQSIHLKDFARMKDTESILKTIESREGSSVTSWRYVFMRDLFTSNIVYSLANGNTGVYVLTSKVLKENVCLSVTDWEYQIEYAAEAEWDTADLAFINSPLEEWQAIVIVCIIIFLVLIVLQIIEGALKSEITNNKS